MGERKTDKAPRKEREGQGEEEVKEDSITLAPAACPKVIRGGEQRITTNAKAQGRLCREDEGRRPSGHRSAIL